MGDLKGILALFTACILLCTVINFFFFYKEKKQIMNIIIVSLILFINQLTEFVVSFWNINLPVLNLVYVVSFNFSISFASYYMLERIQPGSKHNWKALMFSIMILPVGFVYMNTFRMIAPGMFFTEFRYFASPLANCVIGLLTSLWGLFFLIKLSMENKELSKLFHYKLLFWGYALPILIYTGAYFLTLNSVLLFESIYSKLILLNIAGLTFFVIKTKR